MSFGSKLSLSTELQIMRVLSCQFYRKAVNEKAECVAKCTELVCNSILEDTLKTDITLLVDDILEIELERIHKYIKR